MYIYIYLYIYIYIYIYTRTCLRQNTTTFAINQSPTHVLAPPSVCARVARRAPKHHSLVSDCMTFLLGLNPYVLKWMERGSSPRCDRPQGELRCGKPNSTIERTTLLGLSVATDSPDPRNRRPPPTSAIKRQRPTSGQTGPQSRAINPHGLTAKTGRKISGPLSPSSALAATAAQDHLLANLRGVLVRVLLAASTVTWRSRFSFSAFLKHSSSAN